MRYVNIVAIKKCDFFFIFFLHFLSFYLFVYFCAACLLIPDWYIMQCIQLVAQQKQKKEDEREEKKKVTRHKATPMARFYTT